MALCLCPSLIKVMYGVTDWRIGRTRVNYHQTRGRGVSMRLRNNANLCLDFTQNIREETHMAE